MKKDGWDKVISDTDEAVQAWITSVVETQVDVSLAPPSAEVTGGGPPQVRAYLIGLAPAPPTRERIPPLQFWARYLITTWGDTPADEHRLLGRLVMAALHDRDQELDLAPPHHDVWRSFGVAPRPAFSLQVPVRVERAVKAAPPVLKPVILRPVPATTMVGRVLGQNDIPIAGAIVKHVQLDVTSRTNRQGLFRFGMVPAADESQTITVYAKGKHMSFGVRPADWRGEPMIIRFLIKEA